LTASAGSDSDRYATLKCLQLSYLMFCDYDVASAIYLLHCWIRLSDLIPFGIMKCESCRQATRLLRGGVQSDARSLWNIFCKTKCKAIPVRGRGGPWGYGTPRLTHFLDNRLTDGGKAVLRAYRPLLTPRKIPGIHFC
jgi:hypothetical protein